MGNLNVEYFSKPGSIKLLEGEEFREASDNGEYYDAAAHEPKKCYLVFTNKRVQVYVDAKEKGGLFKKVQPGARLLMEAHYDNIESLNRRKVGSDDSFCRVVMKDGNEISFNIFGEVFGPLAAKMVKYSGLDIQKNSILRR